MAKLMRQQRQAGVQPDGFDLAAVVAQDVDRLELVIRIAGGAVLETVAQRTDLAGQPRGMRHHGVNAGAQPGQRSRAGALAPCAGAGQ
ncbi:hypothetical protein D3C71_1985410 [compost metagenome]